MREIVLVLFVFLSASSYAKSLVWEVSKNGNTTYLAGTIHVLSKSDLPLPLSYDQAYKASSVLYFETDMAKAQSVEFQQLLARKVHYPQGQTLLEKLDEPTRDKLKAYMKSNGLPLMQFQQMRAGMVALTISMTEIMRMGMDQEGVDFIYYQQAVKDNKPTFGLESMGRQIEFLARMGEGAESELISQTLDEVEVLSKVMAQLLGAWKSGDVEAMDELMVRDMKIKYPKIYQQLLVERNNNWLPEIERALEDKPVEMILVGAAHLIGVDGLIALLQAKGYSVKQL